MKIEIDFYIYYYNMKRRFFINYVGLDKKNYQFIDNLSSFVNFIFLLLYIFYLLFLSIISRVTFPEYFSPFIMK